VDAEKLPLVAILNVIDDITPDSDNVGIVAVILD
jgi:hypothetical protein